MDIDDAARAAIAEATRQAAIAAQQRAVELARQIAEQQRNR